MAVRLHVHVTPKGGRDEVLGWRGRELQIRVTAAPEGGKANVAVCQTVARALSLAKRDVRVVRGATSRHKTLEIERVGEDELTAAFGEADAPLF